MNNTLEIVNLYSGYEVDKYIINDFSFKLNEGETVGITGQNGCGKSTLAKAIMGMTPYIQGKVIWDGLDITKIPVNERNRMGIAYFMQGGKVFGNLSVEDNLRISLPNKKHNCLAKHLEYFNQFDIDFLTNKRRLRINASCLSGGERHLLGLIMVHLSCPLIRLLIADEPSAGVDMKTQEKIIKLILKKRSTDNISLFLIEQNSHFLKLLTNNIVTLKV
jgi:ABC-type branched-subunit amino acid transport system ATPase component